jgi:GT2 family glycosyltransferase
VTESPPVVSVCILAGHGSAALHDCLASLREQAAPPPFELLVGGRLSTELLALVHEYFPTAQVCSVGRRLPGAARNLLIERARGELLLFLDDDVTAPSGLLTNLVELAREHPEASVFGGPNQTPLHSSRFQTVQGSVLSSLMGAGPVSRRYGARRACEADERWFTLCNLAVRREAMSPFVSSLICAEENALLGELRSRGERMRYDPQLRVYHARRAEWRTFARQMFKYGRGRGEVLHRDPAATRLAYLAPALLLAYLVLLPVLLVLGLPVAAVLAPGAAYVALVLATSAWIARTLRSIRCLPLAPGLVATVHACYGAGILTGLTRPGVAAEEEAIRWAAPVPAGHPRPGPAGHPRPSSAGSSSRSGLEYDSA